VRIPRRRLDVERRRRRLLHESPFAVARILALGHPSDVSGAAGSDTLDRIMSTKPTKLPGPDHPIMIEHNLARVVVVVGGRIVADTRRALTLREAGYRAVQYIPRGDVDMSLLERTQHATYCPYKGECAYYSVPAGGERAVNAVWTYEAPFAAVGAIADHLAFYPDRVDTLEEQPDN
jgi:uncharacterized protein (DUF427 family)